MLNLEQLNEMQRKAVENSEIGPVLVLAGPGSGKTFTITQRIFYLIQVLHIPPQKILVLTFTKDAAASMEKRFLAECNSELSSPYFSTFHSLFYQILKKSKHFTTNHLLNITEKKILLKKAAEAYLSCLKEQLQELKHIPPQFYTEYLDAISIYKNTNDINWALNKISIEYRDYFFHIFRLYERIRNECEKIDFDDCLWECKELLSKDNKMREQWQNRFDYILIDEFQDINPVQYDVIKLLCKKPYGIFAVGDDDQAIYGFRGSSPKCLRRFQEEFHAKKIILNVNYRSTGKIVETANKIIAENHLRYEKNLKAFQDKIKNDYQSLHVKAFNTPEEQNMYLLNSIKESCKQSECAVLFRTNSQMQKFASYLKINHVTFEVREKIKNFYEHQVVMDIMSYLKVLQKKGIKEDAIRLVYILAPTIPREALTYIKQEPSDVLTYYNQESVFGNEKIRKTLQEERNLLQEKLIRIKMLQNKPFFLCIAMLRKQLGYEDYLKNHYSNEEERKEAFSILDFMQEQAGNFSDVSVWEKEQEANQYIRSKNTSQNNNIILMTIHGAKGLEFDRVWIPDCNERIYPYGVLQDEHTIEEERRIFYVGVTRAKKYLELTYLTGTKDSPRQVSRFLKPIL